MRSQIQRRTRWCGAARCLFRGLGALCLASVCLACIGCAKDEKVNHVFVGDAPVEGAVQVVTNKPIDVASVGSGGKTNFERRDCGQFVLVPSHIYRRQQNEAKELDRYRVRFGWFLDPKTGQPVGPDPEAEKDEIRAEMVRM